MHLIEFKICVIAGNGSRVVVTHQIYFRCCYFHNVQKRLKLNILKKSQNGFFDDLIDSVPP